MAGAGTLKIVYTPAPAPARPHAAAVPPRRSAAVKAKSIGSKQLKSNSVTAPKIARNAVTASEIRASVIDGSIGSQYILDGSMTGQDVQDSTLTGADIADNSITSGDITNNDVRLEDLSPDALSGLTDLPATFFTNDYEGNPQSLLINTGYSDFLNWTTPNPRAGVSLLVAQVNVGSDQGTDVTCRLTNRGVTLTQGFATIAAGRRATVSLTTVTDLRANDELRVQCLRTTNAAVVDLSDTALSVIRVAR